MLFSFGKMQFTAYLYPKFTLMASGILEIVCFRIDEVRLALPLNCIERVIRAVAVTQVPNAPQVFHGLIDYHGEILPVINLRYRLNLTDKMISAEQVYIIAKTSQRRLAIVADETEGVISTSEDEVYPVGFLNQGIEAAGALRTNDGMILIYDIDKFLLAEETIEFDNVIQVENP